MSDQAICRSVSFMLDESRGQRHLLWAEPFVLYRADKLSPEEIEAAAAGYTAHLVRWIAASFERAA